MLVLSRKQDQTIQIGDNITVTITQLKGNQVRIGIDAPKEVAIRRGELFNQSDKEVQVSLATSGSKPEVTTVRFGASMSAACCNS